MDVISDDEDDKVEKEMAKVKLSPKKAKKSEIGQLRMFGNDRRRSKGKTRLALYRLEKWRRSKTSIVFR